MPADDHLQQHLFGALGKEAEGMEPEDREFVQAAMRNYGKGHQGPLTAMDADTIDRASSAVGRLSEYGFTARPIGGQHSRGLSIDAGTPHQISVTPARAGFDVSVRHPDRFATNEAGEYIHPEGWGEHDATLPVDEHDLPGALMDYLAHPDVRKKAGFDGA